MLKLLPENSTLDISYRNIHPVWSVHFFRTEADPFWKELI